MIFEDYRELVKAAGEFGYMLMTQEPWVKLWANGKGIGLYSAVLHPDFDDDEGLLAATCEAHGGISTDPAADIAPFIPDKVFDALVDKIATLDPIGTDYWRDLRRGTGGMRPRGKNSVLGPARDWLIP